MLAFSQGGRFVLSILPLYAPRIKSVQLISPDGMDNNSFYNRTSRKKWARKLFSSWESNPKSIMKFAYLGKKLRLVRPKVYQFMENLTADPETFQRASKTWRGFRLVQPNETEISKALSEYKIPFKIIMGKFDQVIRPPQAYAFAKRIHQENKVIEFEAIDLRKFTHDKHKTVDDSPYGGGAGMLMKPEPWGEALDELLDPDGTTVLIVPSPAGELFKQATAQELSKANHLVFEACQNGNEPCRTRTNHPR
jgi:hypothetical protein